MLNFIKGKGNRGKITFDQKSRWQFDKLRDNFKTQNQSARFARQYSYAISPWSYAIAPLGAFNIGQTDDFLQFCKKQNISYTIDPKLQEVIHPKLYIDNIQNLPNDEYQYRDYQKHLIESLKNNGRGVIISPTRSGKSLILAGLFHNTLLKANKNKIKNILLIVPNLLLVQQFKNDLTNYYSIIDEKITITLQNNKKIELNGNDLVETDRGLIKASQLKKTDNIKSISY